MFLKRKRLQQDYKIWNLEGRHSLHLSHWTSPFSHFYQNWKSQPDECFWFPRAASAYRLSMFTSGSHGPYRNLARAQRGFHSAQAAQLCPGRLQSARHCTRVFVRKQEKEHNSLFPNDSVTSFLNRNHCSFPAKNAKFFLFSKKN